MKHLFLTIPLFFSVYSSYSSSNRPQSSFIRAIENADLEEVKKELAHMPRILNSKEFAKAELTRKDLIRINNSLQAGLDPHTQELEEPTGWARPLRVAIFQKNKQQEIMTICNQLLYALHHSEHPKPHGWSMQPNDPSPVGRAVIQTIENRFSEAQKRSTQYDTIISLLEHHGAHE